MNRFLHAFKALILSLVLPILDRLRSIPWGQRARDFMRPLTNEAGWANFRSQYKRQEVLDYNAGQRVKAELDRGNLLRRIVVRVSGELDVSGGSTNGALTDQGVLNLLPEIALVGDGRVYVKRGPAKHFAEKGRIWNGVAPRQTDPAVGVGTNAFSFEIPIFLENAFSRPFDTVLDTAKYSRLELQLLWGTVGDLIQGGDRTNVLQNVEAEILTFEATESPFQAYGLHLDHVVEREVTASSERFQIELPTGNVVPFIILSSFDQDGNGKDVAQDDIINYVTVRGRTGIVYVDRISWEQLKGENNTEAGISPSDGYAYLNPTEDGLLSTAWVTNPEDDLILELDVTVGTNETNVRTLVTEILPASIQSGVRS